MDFRNLGVGKVAVMTDKNVGRLDVVRVALEALEREGVNVLGVFEGVGVEPKEGEYVTFVFLPTWGDYTSYMWCGLGGLKN